MFKSMRRYAIDRLCIATKIIHSCHKCACWPYGDMAARASCPHRQILIHRKGGVIHNSTRQVRDDPFLRSPRPGIAGCLHQFAPVGGVLVLQPKPHRRLEFMH